MKKITILITALLIVFASCHKSSDNDPQQIRKKIAYYKTKITEYQQKINQLQKKLPESKNVAAVPVHVTVVQYTNFKHYLDVTAKIQPIEDAFVNPKTNGEVKKIYVKEGDYVKKGQLLAELDDQIIKNNIEQIKTQLELADSLYQKQKKLYEQGVASEIQYLQAKNRKETLEKNLSSLQTQLQYTKITAPFDGIVDQINIKVGELASPAMRAIYLVNLSKMKAVANLSVKYLPNVKKGTPIELRFEVYPDLVIKSHINYVGNFIDPTTNTFKIEATFNNPQNKIKPNMSATMRFVEFKSNKAIAIPTRILNQDTKGWYVFTIKRHDGQTLAKKQYINLGQISTTKALVLDGLKPGDTVITDGYNLVRDGSVVRIVTN